MSQLHPTEEDDAFAAGHADTGLRKALRHVLNVKAILVECLPYLPSDLRARVETILARSHYDESDAQGPRSLYDTKMGLDGSILPWVRK